jgi:hypothetical protein
VQSPPLRASIFELVDWWLEPKSGWRLSLRRFSGRLFWSGCELGSHVLVRARRAVLHEAGRQVTIALDLDLAFFDDDEAAADADLLLEQVILDKDQT